MGASRRARQVPVVAVLIALGGSGCLGAGGDTECGGAGQPCCAEASCNPDLACGGDDRCAVPPTFTIGGTVTGLTAPELVLRDNGGDPLAIQVAGAFTFPTPLATGSPYSVTVSSQPPGQTCSVSAASGTVGTANVTDVLVACSNQPLPTYTVGGSVAGLAGSGLVLQDNGGDNLPIGADGPFTFPTALTHGDHYLVTILEQPTGQTCTVANGSGVIDAAAVTNVAVSCASNSEPRFSIGGTVSGLAGTGLVLRDNGGDALPITRDGPFTFATALPGGTKYAVTVAGQPSNPSQTCTVSSGSGTVGQANVTGVVVTCVTNPVPRYTVGGTAGGLAGPGLVLRNNGGDDLAVTSNGPFTFATPLTSGSPYAVTVFGQPSGQTCSVSGGSGTVGNNNVTSVTVTCVTNPPPRYTVGGTVSGLAATGLVLRNSGADGLSISVNGPFTFASPLTSGSSYSVTVFSQPSGQTCTVAGGSGTIGNANVTSVAVSCVTNRYTVGGTVSGLAGSGLVLRNNGADNLSISANGPFTFATTLTSGSSYSVTVFSQPSGQTCTVSAGTGTVGNANVTSAAVSCATNPPPRFTVGGTVSGLTASGLVLQDNGADNLAISASGSFTFPTALTSGSSYSVTVFSQPSGQTCTVSGGSGAIGNANVTSVSVSCSTNPPPRFTVGGTVGGLASSGLVLRNNGADNLSISANGPFTFPTALTSGSTYSVTVFSQPSGQTCTVSGGSGTVGNANVTTVVVTCATNPPPRFTVGGTVTGLSASGLVLRNNGADNLSIPANGPFTFPTALTSGSGYSVTVFSQPSGQTCTVSGGSGTVGNANVTTVVVTCATNPPPRFTIGGTVNGFSASGLVLRNNGADDLSISANGPFTFPTALTSGSGYSVTVFSQPSGQTCTVSGGSGTVGNANVTTVVVTCATNPPPRFTIGGTVSGLGASGLVLQNNGADNLSISANGPFTFATALTSGSTYSVTVFSQPSGQSCTVSAGTGTVGNANVTSVLVSCSPASPSQPTLVQHVSSGTNILGRGLRANDFRLTLPNPVGSGNVLVLGISYGAPAGKTATVRDNQGNGWPAAPAVSGTNPGGDIASAIFVLPNARPGITTITIAFSAPIDNTVFQYTISEFHGVATTAPVSGTSSSSGRQPALSAGAFTPVNNDANGGNLIWSYFADASGATSFGTQPSRFTAGPGATLLDADIAAPTSAPPFPHASQYQLQLTAGPVTPSMSAAPLDGGGDEYVGVAVALKASSGAGTPPPPGMRIVHLSHLTNQNPDVGTWRLQFPSSGNLVVLTMQETNIIPVASVTDNLGNSYLHVEPDDTVPQFWIAQGPARTDPTLELTVNLTGGLGSGVTYLLYDVAGASASSYDGVAFKIQYDDPNGSDVFDSPVITPSSAPGLTITATSFGRGPSSGLASGCPAGSIFDFVYYTGETDLDTMDNADFRAHVFHTDRSTQHWNIAVSNGNVETNASSSAAHFK